MYDRQSYEVDGRHVFWGGLHVGTVDGGRGLIEGHRRAAANAAVEVLLATPSPGLIADRNGDVAGVRYRAAGSGPGVRAPRSGGDRRRGRLRVRPATARALPRPGMGRRQGARDPVQHRRAARGDARVRRTPVRALERLPQRSPWDAGAPPTGDRELTNRLSRQSYPARASSSTATASASSTRAPTSATTPTPSTAPRCCSQPRRDRLPALRRRRPAPLLRTDEYEAPGRVARSRPTRSRALADGARDRRRTARAHRRASSTRRSRRRPFDPAVKDGKRTRGHRRRRSPTGRCRSTTPPFVAFPVTCGITFTFGGVRVDDGARVLDIAAAGRSPGLLRGRRAGRRPVLPQLPGRHRAHVGRGVRTTRRVSCGRPRRTGARPRRSRRRARITSIERSKEESRQ